jgi:flagellar biosynthesis protein FlhG
MIVDTAAGISESVINFCCASHEVIVVVCDEPASITDAYAFIKVMSRDHKIEHFQILANMAHTTQEGRELFHKLSKATDRFLDVMLTFMGTIPYDERLRKAVQHQRAVVDAFPRSPSALALKRMARQVDDWPDVHQMGGQLEFFIERLINSDADIAGVC